MPVLTGYGMRVRNWARTHECHPEMYFEPENEGEVAEILARARENGRRVRPTGAQYSPNGIFCTDDYMIDTRRMNRILNIDEEKRQATVEAGITLRHLCEALNDHGLAFTVLPSLLDASLAGSISTTSHGTGAACGILATFIVKVKFMNAMGEILTVTREENPDLFRAVCASLGTLGVILELTIQCEPAFNLHRTIDDAPTEEVLENLDAHVDSVRHFQMQVFPYTGRTLVVKDDVTTTTANCPRTLPRWYNLVHQVLNLICQFIPSLVGWVNWFFLHVVFAGHKEFIEPSYHMFEEVFTPIDGQEWAVPRENAKSALKEFFDVVDKGSFSAHFPCHIRFAKADDLMLSTCYGRDTSFVSVPVFNPFYRKTAGATKYWQVTADVMRKHGGRPHWGKQFELDCDELKPLYPEWDKFCNIRKKMDPQNMFSNRRVDQIFGKTTTTTL